MRLSGLAGLSWKIWVVAAIAILAVGGGLYWKVNSGASYQFVTAARRDVVETVSVTGTVKPGAEITLEFLSSGRVAYRPYQVGDQVPQGAEIIALDARDAATQIAKAEAALAGSLAKLDQLKAGAAPETIIQLENARDAEYWKALAALDAVITKADGLATVLRADIFQQNNVVRSDLGLPADSVTAGAERAKAEADAKLAELKTMRNETAADNFANLENLLMQAPVMAEAVRAAGVASTDLLRKVISPVVTQTTVTTYLDELTGARAGLDASFSAFASSVSILQAAKDALNVKLAPARDADLAALEANVQSAEADLELLQKQRADLALYAPVDGIITELEYEVGENARLNTAAAKMISVGGLEIEANAPEVDIAKIALANPVKITIDALPGESFSGRVTHIDPAETVVDGVTNYKIKVSFDANNPRLKSGATANLIIETLRKPNVLTLPQVGILEKDQGTFVKKLVNGRAAEVPVVAGIRSSDGYVEIISGVAESEMVLNAGVKTE